MSAEGWYKDPFSLHENRWFSAGRPTDLVSDAGVEGKDAPPTDSYDGPLEDVAAVEAADGSDLLRAGSDWVPASERGIAAATIDQAGGTWRPT